MLVIQSSGHRKVSPLHILTQGKQADRCAGSSYFLSPHIQVNLFYEFFACASRFSVSLRRSSRRLISSLIASDVISDIIQLFAFWIAAKRPLTILGFARESHDS